MKKIKFFVCVLAVCFCVFLAVSCTACTNPFVNLGSECNSVSIVSYNTQTFFDAVEDGGEFKEFKGNKSKWSKEKYAERLMRLKEAVHIAAVRLGFGETDIPDILVLQEIESKTVIEDFCKLLPLDNSYRYAVFIPSKKQGAFSTALLSKFPVDGVKVYDVYAGNTDLRPLVECRIKLRTAKTEEEIVLLNVHWKSKVGKGETDKIRFLQEKQAFDRLCFLEKTEPDTPFVLCGDFNQVFTEFSLLNEFPNCWDSEDYKEAAENGIQKAGSYFFKDSWEDIDHIFYSRNLKDGRNFDLTFFCVIDSPPLINKNGEPSRYSVLSGSGYSDHLPIGCVLKLQ
ncbi:endonuclease/exonuclease/phosphatase family protein [Treponema pedis]|uniref:Endonuclease/exonuclease/phosphatase family protein n=1 Tax=Treponema pedis TaxID=409322 RepID=A0A7S6WQ24_9SPIR|nr:endonuclease/exonuclease/phosphatase family protein [Treponema pedis]QOW61244.1 endonuclease/exonuclease/phosphatase family protein [Treponema pedis]